MGWFGPWFKKEKPVARVEQLFPSSEPWKGYGAHGSRYRTEFDVFAEALSKSRGDTVRSRFNAESRNIELHSAREGVIASFYFRSECGSPYAVYIATDLDASARDMFEKAFPSLCVRFKPLVR